MPTSGCPANGSSVPGVKMRRLPLAGIIDEDRLGETEVRRYRLAIALRHLAAVEEHAERVAPGAPFADKDLQHVKPSQTDPFTSEPVAATDPKPEAWTSNSPASPDPPTPFAQDELLDLAGRGLGKLAELDGGRGLEAGYAAPCRSL